jgi:nucleoside-diphosphate kinase
MSFLLIKPDAVEAGQVGEILSRFERKGYKISVLKCLDTTLELVQKHYEEHKGKDFYDGLCDYMTNKKIVAVKLECSRGITKIDDSSIADIRKLVGNVNQPGTIRGDFAKSLRENSIHASDSYLAYVRECMLWFS